jgi:carbonic anhydrase/acetyltransferase-like protein (isoleucine patch superfamily)
MVSFSFQGILNDSILFWASSGTRKGDDWPTTRDFFYTLSDGFSSSVGGFDPMIRDYQGKMPIVPASCYTDISAQILGDVTLGERSSVWMNAVLRGDVNAIRIGSCSNVQDCAVLHGQRHVYPVIIGDWVTIGHNATVHGCVVEDRVMIGMGATVLNDAHIGEGSIIAAGAVVPEHTKVPPRTLWTGVPAKMRRELNEKDQEMILQYAKNYLDYVAIYLNEPVEAPLVNQR